MTADDRKVLQTVRDDLEALYRRVDRLAEGQPSGTEDREDVFDLADAFIRLHQAAGRCVARLDRRAAGFYGGAK